MIGCIALNFEIISYKILLDMLYLSLGFSERYCIPKLHIHVNIISLILYKYHIFICV
jgi:hypothetical protein